MIDQLIDPIKNIMMSSNEHEIKKTHQNSGCHKEIEVTITKSNQKREQRHTSTYLMELAWPFVVAVSEWTMINTSSITTTTRPSLYIVHNKLSIFQLQYSLLLSILILMRNRGVWEDASTATVLVLVLCSSYGIAEVKSQSQKVSGLFVFGDSLVEVGNNNFLNTIARANYFPYGIDFSRGSTGRFSNGKSLIDFIGKLL